MELFREQLLLLVTVPVILGAILLEIIVTHFHGIRAYTKRETLTNFYMAALNGSLDLLLRAVLVLPLLLWCWNRRVMDLEQGWVYWIALFLLQDLAYYVLHFVDHHCRLFWAVHVTHHSSEEFNLTTGFRSSVFQPVYRTFYFLPIAWLGFEPLDILFMYAATQIYGSLIHTERIRSMGWLEHVLVTPSHHRVHHASNGRYLDKNMGMCLIVWDRLFGTFQAELPEEPVRYGLTRKIEDRGPVNIVLHEWRDMWADVKRSSLPWWKRLGYVLRGPGWKAGE
ncbi:sterol desaturase/sphingolipid hydroxylase (fatty acid hydroxylase superfamily) [Prosthecobacter fusiformis]|uniref:Sterol desaturase/sphingolipid hydroxylase (Fatty acid hydroxylase superfamily) n=1 Tax=Prosthecobacter fusiformis TaxID=48464 RepID=A0A4R7RI77_9BACT|nr:sterol desaturase family protein [Prosthecobacter fusiformis]TDU62495.1 sterol desaturase/sphingolipid hydroxylase (fatty acid hydroxylase superfamily) [Prosthecobacter fusiformis]